jgi:hypothetical protein
MYEYQKPPDYKPFSYKVPGLEGYELPTQQSVWNTIEKKAEEAVVIPININEIREEHESRLEQFIEEGKIIAPEVKIKMKGYIYNSLIFSSIKDGYYLGLKKHGNDVEDDAFYYYKRLELYKLYFEIAMYCSSLYFKENFRWVRLPKNQYSYCDMEEIYDKEKKIKELRKIRNKSKNIALRQNYDDDIYSLIREIEETNTRKTFTPEQAMKIFLDKFHNIKLSSKSFLKQVILYHLQQQEDFKKKYKKAARKNKDRKNKRKFGPTKANIKQFIAFNYFKNNPDVELKKAKNELSIMDAKTVKKYMDKFHKNS